MLSAPGTGRASARRAVALGAAAAALACVTVAGAASPALADSVRTRQQWVLDAIQRGRPPGRSARARASPSAVIDSGVNPDVPDLDGSVRPGRTCTNVGTPSSNPNWGRQGRGWRRYAGHGHDGGGSGIIGVAPGFGRILSIRVITDRPTRDIRLPAPAAQRRPAGAGQGHHRRGPRACRVMACRWATARQPVPVPGGPAGRHRPQRRGRHASSGNSGDAWGRPGGVRRALLVPGRVDPACSASGPVGPPASPRPSSQREPVRPGRGAPGVNGSRPRARDSQYWLVSGRRRRAR